jgi:hypothetical protein
VRHLQHRLLQAWGQGQHTAVAVTKFWAAVDLGALGAVVMVEEVAVEFSLMAHNDIN